MEKRSIHDGFAALLKEVFGFIKGGFPLGEMNGDFAAKFIWACTFLFVYCWAGETFLFKIVKMNLTNSQQKNLPQLLDQSKHKYILIFDLSANTFHSDQIEDGW